MREKLEEIAQLLPNAALGQLFGKPSVKLGKVHFICGYQGCLVVKIGKEAIENSRSKYEHAQLFDPSGKGRPMKDWLQLPQEYEEDWLELAREAYNFVK